MKNTSSLKAKQSETPKTPGGISKSLLTPCRRLGLSRNWKKSVASPFISPLTIGTYPEKIEVREEKTVSRKRKERVAEEETEDKSDENEIQIEETLQTPVETCGTLSDVSVRSDKTQGIVSTPSRHIEIPRKKKSKLLEVLGNCGENTTHLQRIKPNCIDDQSAKLVAKPDAPVVQTVSSLVRIKSKSKVKKASPINLVTVAIEDEIPKISDIKENIGSNAKISEVAVNNASSKPVIPNNLTKECIVVIQKKIFKSNKKSPGNKKQKIKEDKPSVVETIADSDLDDVPLCCLNKNVIIETINDRKENTGNKVEKEIAEDKQETHKEITIGNDVQSEVITISEDDDFTEANTSKVFIKKLVDKKTSTGGLNTSTKNKPNIKLKLQKTTKVSETKHYSQSSNSFDEDDEDFDNKRTILIRKTYNKVTKPLKARSTGSITQRDIDDLRARIEMKKKMLLAKVVTEDTVELRGLIKKWQKGCQDALMELMELMKAKFPEKQNMDYSEMLKGLGIPAPLVGYDSENECFNTPDDSDIVLSKFNNL